MKNISKIRIPLISICFSALLIVGCLKTENPPNPTFTIEDNKITSKFHSGFGNQIVTEKDHVLIKDYYSIYIFKITGQSIELIQTIDFLQSASIGQMRLNNSTLVFGIDQLDGFKVLIYERIGDSWNFKQEIRGKTQNDWFGTSIDIEGDYLVIGAPADRPNGIPGTREGRLYIYHKTIDGWKQEHEFLAEHSVLGDQFGSSVAIHDDFVIAGSLWSLLHIFKYENTWALSRVDSMYIGEMNHCNSNFMYYDHYNNTILSFTLEPDGNFNFHPINFDFDLEETSGFVIKDSLALVSGNWTNKCHLLNYDNGQWTKKMVFEPDSEETCTFSGKAITKEYVVLGGSSFSSEVSYVYFRKY